MYINSKKSVKKRFLVVKNRLKGYGWVMIAVPWVWVAVPTVQFGVLHPVEVVLVGGVQLHS